MSTSYLTPNMELVVPVPNQAPGPDWAEDLNASLVIIDAHSHTSGNGVAITPSAININADLSFNISYNATQVRSTRYASQGSAIPNSSPDVGCTYVSGNELYYNDLSGGHQVQLTANGSVNAGAGSIGGLPSGTASVNYSAVAATYVFQSATSTAGNIDAASVIVRYPGSYPSPVGNGIALEAPSSLSSYYALTLPALPAQTNVMSLGATGIISSITYDAVGQGMSSTGANAIAASRTRTTSTTVGIGGVAIANDSGAFQTSNTVTWTLVTNQTITITTSGRPVRLFCMSSSTASQSVSGGGYILLSATSTVNSVSGGIAILRGGAFITNFYRTLAYTNLAGANWVIGNAPGEIEFIDTPTAGTYTYTLEALAGPNTTVSLVHLALVAYEL